MHMQEGLVFHICLKHDHFRFISINSPPVNASQELLCIILGNKIAGKEYWLMLNHHRKDPGVRGAD